MLSPLPGHPWMGTCKDRMLITPRKQNSRSNNEGTGFLIDFRTVCCFHAYSPWSSFFHHKVKTHRLFLPWSFISLALLFYTKDLESEWFHIKNLNFYLLLKNYNHFHATTIGRRSGSPFCKWSMSLSCLASSKSVTGPLTIHPVFSTGLALVPGLWSICVHSSYAGVSKQCPLSS